MKTYRKYAKSLIKNNLLSAVICILFTNIVYLILKCADFAINTYFYPYYISDFKNLIFILVVILLHFILLYPLKIGRIKCFYDNCVTKIFKLSNLFYYYSSFKLFIGVSFSLLIKKAILMIFAFLTIVPAYSFVKIAFMNALSPIIQAISLILLTLSAIIYLLFSCSLFLTEYIIVETEKNVFFAIFKSISLMRGNIINLVEIFVRFIPLFALCLTIIPAFYVLPLYNQTTAYFANRIIFRSPICARASLAGI